MTSSAPAAMPSEEDVARAIRGARLRAMNAPPIYVMFNDDAPAEDADLASARAILDLFAPILAEKQKPTVALNHWKARALAAEAALTEIRARHAEWRKCMPADWEGDPLSHAIEAAAIRAQGE